MPTDVQFTETRPHVARLHAGVENWLAALHSKSADDQRIAQQKRELNDLVDLPDYILRDIGVTRDDVREAKRNLSAFGTVIQHGK